MQEWRGSYSLRTARTWRTRYLEVCMERARNVDVTNDVCIQDAVEKYLTLQIRRETS